MREIRTETQLTAPPEHVWAVVADFERYGEWNPFMTQMQGEPRVDASLHMRVETPGKRANGITARMLVADEPRELRWNAKLLAPWLFSATHVLELMPRDGGTHFVNREEFRGLLAPLMLRYMGSSLPAGYAAMNQALQTRLGV